MKLLKKSTYRNNLQTLEERKKEKDEESQPYTEQMDELKNTALKEVDWNTMNELQNIKAHMDFLYKLLTSKDSFIRKRIIDKTCCFKQTLGILLRKNRINSIAIDSK